MSHFQIAALVFILLFLIQAVAMGYMLFRSIQKIKEDEESFLEQGVQKGISFAEETLRNYPETGVQTLRDIAKRHQDMSLDYNLSFAKGIENVLYNLENPEWNRDR